MMVKENKVVEKRAAGDAGVLDDMVDLASAKFAKAKERKPFKTDGGSCPKPEARG